MINVEMTEAEAAVFIAMLERASEEFSNHGCNDFHLVQDAGLKPKDVSPFLKRMVESGTLDDEADVKGPYTMDWIILSHLQTLIEKACNA
jgi:hypothetical protein